jgi:hypothetical protein
MWGRSQHAVCRCTAGGACGRAQLQRIAAAALPCPALPAAGLVTRAGTPGPWAAACLVGAAAGQPTGVSPVCARPPAPGGGWGAALSPVATIMLVEGHACGCGSGAGGGHQTREPLAGSLSVWASSRCSLRLLAKRGGRGGRPGGLLASLVPAPHVAARAPAVECRQMPLPATWQCWVRGAGCRHENGSLGDAASSCTAPARPAPL